METGDLLFLKPSIWSGHTGAFLSHLMTKQLGIPVRALFLVDPTSQLTLTAITLGKFTAMIH